MALVHEVPWQVVDLSKANPAKPTTSAIRLKWRQPRRRRWDLREREGTLLGSFPGEAGGQDRSPLTAARDGLGTADPAPPTGRGCSRRRQQLVEMGSTRPKNGESANALRTDTRIGQTMDWISCPMEAATAAPAGRRQRATAPGAVPRLRAAGPGPGTRPSPACFEAPALAQAVTVKVAPPVPV